MRYNALNLSIVSLYVDSKRRNF